jgi:hypothetical protein
MKNEDNVISITRNSKKSPLKNQRQTVTTSAPHPTPEQMKRMWREALNFEQPVAPNVTRVDGARGLVTKCLIEILEDCVGDFEMDYEELTVADLFEYLVDWQEASQKRNQRR